MKGERGEESKERGKERGEGENCSHCRGGPTATYKLHSYKCLSVTCDCEQKQAGVPNVQI